jgi:hypothetical protein
VSKLCLVTLTLGETAAFGAFPMFGRKLIAPVAAGILATAFLGTAAAAADIMSFRALVFPESKSITACSQEAMAALSESGFTQGLQFLKGQPPSIAISGGGPEGLAMIICAQKHDLIFTLSASGKSGTEIEASIMSLVENMLRRMGCQPIGGGSFRC